MAYTAGVIRNVIFDWSGTLVDDLPAVWAATNHVLRQAGRPELSLAAFRAEFCLPFTGFYDRHVPDVPLAQLETWFHTFFQTAQDSVVVLPHAREFLQFCRQRGWRTFVLSTVRQDHFARQAERTGLGRFIDLSYVGIRDKRRKIHALMAENGLHPDETLLVGDMQHDIETARHGGVRAAAVLTGYNTLAQLRAAGPDLIVEHLGELQGRLESGDLKPGTADNSLAGRRAATVLVCGLVSDSAGRLLLTRSPECPDHWDLPGGVARRGEGWPDALRRLLKQQTGLDLRNMAFLRVHDSPAASQNGQDGPVLLAYTGRVTDDLVARLPNGTDRFCWLPLPEATALPLTQTARALLETAPAPTAIERP